MRGFGYDALPFEDEFAAHNEADLGAGGLKIARAMQKLGGGVQIGFEPVFVPRPEEDNDETAVPGDPK